MKKLILIAAVLSLSVAACTPESQFSGWQTEEFDLTQITASTTKQFVLANNSEDSEQHVRAIAFDRGSNSAGHFKIQSITVGNSDVDATDIVIPPKSALTITVNYTPKNLETTEASYGGWKTGGDERWIPKSPEEVERDAEEAAQEKLYAIHRSIIEIVYDYPKEGIYFIQLVGEATVGPKGEDEAGGPGGDCTPGNGIACYTGGFTLDIPQLVPDGPKELELSGPISINIGSSVSMVMDGFPYVLFYLRSEEIPQLPSGVTATLVISGTEGVEAEGSFDGSRLTLTGVSFRIRVALGELTIDQVKQGMSSLVDFDISDLTIETTSPLEQSAITLHMETALPQNPSGNELFDQFLSGADIIAVMDGELSF
jgi:hypothetical protein